jgi:hypothetical protein
VRVTSSRFKFMRLGIYSNAIYDIDSIHIVIVDCGTGEQIASDGALDVLLVAEPRLIVVPKVSRA